jgi:hypothetical protein
MTKRNKVPEIKLILPNLSNHSHLPNQTDVTIQKTRTSNTRTPDILKPPTEIYDTFYLHLMPTIEIRTPL